MRRRETALIVYNAIESTRKKTVGKLAIELSSILPAISEPVFRNFKSYYSVCFKDLFESMKSY